MKKRGTEGPGDEEKTQGMKVYRGISVQDKEIGSEVR